MRATINGIDIEGTPAEIVEYLTAATQSATNGYVKPEPEHRVGFTPAAWHYPLPPEPEHRPYPLPPEPEPEPEPAPRLRISLRPKNKETLDGILAFDEGIPASGIAKLLDISESTASGRIQKLRKLRLIEKIPGTTMWRGTEKARTAEIFVA